MTIPSRRDFMRQAVALAMTPVAVKAAPSISASPAAPMGLVPTIVGNSFHWEAKAGEVPCLPEFYWRGDGTWAAIKQ